MSESQDVFGQLAGASRHHMDNTRLSERSQTWKRGRRVQDTFRTDLRQTGESTGQIAHILSERFSRGSWRRSRNVEAAGAMLY